MNSTIQIRSQKMENQAQLDPELFSFSFSPPIMSLYWIYFFCFLCLVKQQFKGGKTSIVGSGCVFF